MLVFMYTLLIYNIKDAGGNITTKLYVMVFWGFLPSSTSLTYVAILSSPTYVVSQIIVKREHDVHTNNY